MNNVVYCLADEKNDYLKFEPALLTRLTNMR